MASNGVPKPVPPPQPKQFAPGSTLVTPLSRKGSGPGLIVIVDDIASGASIKHGIPSPLMKWAEEGYCVVEILKSAFEQGVNPIQGAVEELERCSAYDANGSFGVVCYEPSLLSQAISNIKNVGKIKALAAYTSSSSSDLLNQSDVPVLLHISGTITKTSINLTNVKAYHYADQTSVHFATPFTKDFNYASEAVSHSRNLTFLKKHMDGPYFDLETIWDEHTNYEFGDRSVENTMNTMVEEPYVNHIPTLTGGIGRKDLTAFYQNHFIFSNPDDSALELISRTVGIDRVVDEFVFKCSHNRVIDWLLPGVPPTNRYIEIPMVAFVNVRGDRLYHEHIAWDQATALRQVGLLPEYVTMDKSMAETNAHQNQSNGQVHARLRLPIGGKETVMKMRDKNSVPSNEMFTWGVQSSS